jgi:hypothetical protein
MPAAARAAATTAASPSAAQHALVLDGPGDRCENGERVRVAFALTAAIARPWASSHHGGITGEDVRDLMVAAVEAPLRPGPDALPRHDRVADRQRQAATSRARPAASPGTSAWCRARRRWRARNRNGMAEAFVRTLKRDYVRVSPVPDAASVLRQLPSGCRTTTSFTPTARWATVRRASSSPDQPQRTCPAIKGNTDGNACHVHHDSRGDEEASITSAWCSVVRPEWRRPRRLNKLLFFRPEFDNSGHLGPIALIRSGIQGGLGLDTSRTSTGWRRDALCRGSMMKGELVGSHVIKTTPFNGEAGSTLYDIQYAFELEWTTEWHDGEEYTVKVSTAPTPRTFSRAAVVKTITSFQVRRLSGHLVGMGRKLTPRSLTLALRFRIFVMDRMVTAFS